MISYNTLTHLNQTCQTLVNAVSALASAPDSPVSHELQQNGSILLQKLSALLDDHNDSILDPSIRTDLALIQETWDHTSEYSQLSALLSSWQRKLPHGLSYRVRAVFFAELGAKWDSMSSVYQFMAQDPRFDPVVVLTPIFRCDRPSDDGQHSATVYEDYLTPLGIPFVHYFQYDIEADRPDLTFISQPYESVSPQSLWPETISAYTRLIYLPYFIPLYVDAFSAVTLARLPIHYLAWKIAAINEIHYDLLKKYSFKHGSNLVLTGLPKTDAAVQLRACAPPLPHDWQSKISGKKVFLVSSWMNITSQFYALFARIIDWIQIHEDCALIWRPHPMLFSMTRANHPDHVEFLQQLIDRIQSSPNMILDQFPSYDISFFYSDALISEPSSLVYQYLFMDRPTFVWSVPNSFSRSAPTVFTEWYSMGLCFNAILSFLEEVHLGQDRNAQLRQTCLSKDFPLSDGHCGERLCERLWLDLHEEDHIPL